MNHDVIDNVARLVFLLYASFRHKFSYQFQVQMKWSKGPCMLPPALKIFTFLKDLIFEYFDIENTYQHFDVGKM